MAEFNFIEFQRTRDFSNKMNVTIEFVKQNFKSFGRCVLYFIGPPALVVGLLAGSLIGNTRDLFLTLSQGGLDTADWTNLILKISLILVGGTITSIITTATVIGYVIIYRQKQSGDISTDEVWDYIKDNFFMYFGVMLGVVVIAILAFGVMLLPVMLLGFLNGFLGGVAVVAYFVGIFYLTIANSLVILVRGFEKKGFFDCFRRSMFLTYGKWWSTFGLLIVFGLIVSITSSLVAIPWSISNTVNNLHDISDGEFNSRGTDWFGIISNTLSYLFQYLLGVLPQIALIFQYFNLVEMKESKGLIEKMETMGAPDQTNTNAPKEDY
jgi:hypothetical protein